LVLPFSVFFCPSPVFVFVRLCVCVCVPEHQGVWSLSCGGERGEGWFFFCLFVCLFVSHPTRKDQEEGCGGSKTSVGFNHQIRFKRQKTNRQQQAHHRPAPASLGATKKKRRSRPHPKPTQTTGGSSARQNPTPSPAQKKERSINNNNGKASTQKPAGGNSSHIVYFISQVSFEVVSQSVTPELSPGLWVPSFVSTLQLTDRHQRRPPP
jgi:hypothetical protein